MCTLALACKVMVSIAGLQSARLSAQEGLVYLAVCSMFIASHDTNDARVVSLIQTCLPADLIDLEPPAQEHLAPLVKQLLMLHFSTPMSDHNTIHAMYGCCMPAGS